MVYSADRIPGAEYLAAHKIFTALFIFNLKGYYSEFFRFVRARISIAIVRSNSLLIRGP